MMAIDRLAELLERADAQLPPRTAATISVRRVQARAKRRVTLQAVFAFFVSAAIVMTALHRSRPRPRVADVSSTSNSADVADARLELAKLDALAAVHCRAAVRIMNAEHDASARQSINRKFLLDRDPLAPLAEAKDRAARILLMDGDRLKSRPAQQARAEAVYRRAVDLFPGTPAAREAAERLKPAGV